MTNADNKIKKFLDWVNADENLPTLEELGHGHDDHEHDDHGHDDHVHDDHGHDDHGHDDHGHDDHHVAAHEASAEEKDSEEPVVEEDQIDEELVYPDVVAEDDEVAEDIEDKSDSLVIHRTGAISASKKQKTLMGLFRFFYLAASTLLAFVIIGLLLMTVSELPKFGGAANPTVNEVYTRYVEKGMEETGALNIVAAMILDYRAFDTLGEAIVLFTAAMGVVLLIRKPKSAFVHAPGGKEGEDDAEKAQACS